MKLGELLLHDDVITQEHLDSALTRQRQQGGMLGEILVQNQIISLGTLEYYLGCQKRHKVEERRQFHQISLIKSLFKKYYSLSPLYVVVCIILLLFGMALTMTFPYFVKFTFDYLVNANDIWPLLWIGCGVIVLQVAAQFTNYYGSLFANIANIRLSNSIRDQQFRIIQHLHYTTLTQKKNSEWVNHLTADIDHVIERWERLVITFFKNLFGISISCTLLLLIDPKLTLIVLILSIITVLIPGKISNKANKYLGRRPIMINSMVSYLKERLYGVKTIKTFNAQSEVNREFSSRFKEYYRNDFLMVRCWNVAFNLRVTLGSAMAGAILFFGGHKVISGEYGIGDLMMVIVTINILSPNIDQFMQLIISMNDTKAYWQRCIDVLNINIDEKRFDNTAISSTVQTGHLKLNRINFRYKELSVFNQLSIEFKPKRTYTVFGKSGSGKSTLLKLILKQLQPSSGQITLDGIPLSILSDYSTCQHISYIAQSPSVFKDTIGNNIRMGGMMFCKNITQEQVVDAAKKAGIHERILAMPDQYDTLIGEQNQALSGGEMQRLSIARALLKQPTVCLFDEPTSSLDPDNERLVMETIQALRGYCTIIISTHNPDYLDLADEVLILDDNPRFLSPVRLNRESLINLLKKPSTTFKDISATQGAS